ncbi:hypothetical protein [Natrinema marinum]|uniref:hypothetical protein n=1 Tax=Natrinema marinum TaxID=2961598 RepID=UPI0020C91A22|nr:hypothetical protein [Natrinema marinum]
MSEDTTSRKTDSAGLENIRRASDAVEKSTTSIALEKILERWRTVGAIVVLAVTSVLLYQVDNYLSIDVQVFGGITILMLGYFLATLRTDIRME